VGRKPVNGLRNPVDVTMMAMKALLAGQRRFTDA